MQWLVLLEAERAGGGIDGARLRQLLDTLADSAPSGLHSDDRYAVQIEVEAAGPPNAIAVAIRRWHAAHWDLDLPLGNLVRVEVLTRDEFERECLFYEQEVGWGPAWSSPDGEQQWAAEDVLLRHALHDSLTDVAGRGLFRAQLDAALAGDLVAQPCAILLLDVDHLATVNERLGRQAGDAVLVALAARLRQAVSPPATVGRLGGDQFAIILRDTSAAEAPATARLILDRTSAPLTVEGAEVRPTVSAGLAVSEISDTAEDLLLRATLALRWAQEQGRARMEVFAESMARADVRLLLAERDTMASPDARSQLGLLDRRRDGRWRPDSRRGYATSPRNPAWASPTTRWPPGCAAPSLSPSSSTTAPRACWSSSRQRPSNPATPCCSCWPWSGPTWPRSPVRRGPNRHISRPKTACAFSLAVAGCTSTPWARAAT